MVNWNEPKLWAAFDDIHKMYLSFPSEGEKYDGYVILKHSVLMTVIIGPYLIGIISFIFKGYSDGLRSEVVEPLVVLVSSLICVLVIFSYFLLGNRYRAMLVKMDMTKEVPKKVLEANIFINRLTWIVFYGLFVVNIFFAILIYLSNMHCEARELTGDKRYVCGLQHYVWYPFETEDSSLRKVLVAVVTGGGQAIFLSFYTPSFIGLFGIPHIIRLRMNDLREQIEAIDKNNIQQFTENFADFVEYYSKIIGKEALSKNHPPRFIILGIIGTGKRCAGDMNRTFGNSLSSAYTLCTLFIAIIEYICIIEGNHEYIFVLLLCLSGLYVSCRIGQNLEDEHKRLILSVQALRWYNMPVDIRKNYSLFLGKVQMPVHIELKPHVKYNNEYLLSAIQTSYSLATFLMNTTNEE